MLNSDNSEHGSSEISLVSEDKSRDGDFSNSEHKILEDRHLSKDKIGVVIL